MKRILLFIAFFGTQVFTLVAQTGQELLDQLLEEERNSVEALALYPQDTRLAIFEGSKYPEALVKLETLQSKTSESFRNLMENYPKETQEMIWDLTRYPGLISRLAAMQDVETVLNDYPEEIHQRARKAANEHPALLVEVDNITRQWEAAFGNLIQDYPPVTQDAIRQLVDLPEVLTILTENIRLTVLVGDMYRNYPTWLVEQMDSLNLVVARERTKELDDWKNSLEENPQAKEELVQSAQDFAGEYTYDDDYYDYNGDWYSEDRVVIEHNYYHHYPYWFGYPYWYVYPRWRPYPLWYDWGFYWGPGHVIIIIDMPSWYFTNWYFHYPHHHHYYSHLSSHFVNHYYGHRRSGGSITVTVNNWRNQNREIITDEWMEKSRTRADAFKEYGKFETERQKYNRSHPEKQVSQREFAEKNTKRYPTIAKEAEQQRSRHEIPAAREPQSTKEPVIEKPKIKEPSWPPTREPETREPVKPKTEKPPVDKPKVDKADEYHRNRWEQTKPEQKPKVQAPERKPAPPKPKVEKPKSEPKTKAPSRSGNDKKSGGRNG